MQLAHDRKLKSSIGKGLSIILGWANNQYLRYKQAQGSPSAGMAKMRTKKNSIIKSKNDPALQYVIYLGRTNTTVFLFLMLFSVEGARMHL